MRATRFFKFLQGIAIAAILCTLAVTAIMMIYSATPGEKSAQQSNQVADNIKDTFDIKDETIEGARVQLSEVKGFAGEQYSLDVKFFPETTTDKDVSYSSSAPTVAEVSADGRLTFKAAGTAKITVALKSDPSVKHSATAMCYGTHPSKITSVSLASTSFKVGATQPFDLKDQDGNKLLLNMFSASKYDNTLFSFTSTSIMPLQESQSPVTLTIRKNLGKKDYEQQTFGPLTIKIVANPNFKKPESVTLVNGGVYDLKIGEEVSLPSLVESIVPAGINPNTLNYNYDTKSNVVRQLVDTRVLGQSVGALEVTISSRYNPSLKATMIINVYKPKPTKLSVLGPKNARAQYDSSYTLKAFGDEDYVDEVTWSIVKGTGTIDPKTGKLSGLKLGKNVTVRATYNDDPTLYADYELKVVMYENFASSMRKLVGHFLLFAVIGFGLACSYVFLIKPRALAVLPALASGFGLAVVSEALQLPTVTTGRYATWSDVFIDFFGSVLGMAAAFIIIGIILLAFRLSKSRKEFGKAFSAMSAKTLFRRANSSKVQALLSDAPASSENAQEAGATIEDESQADEQAPTDAQQNQTDLTESEDMYSPALQTSDEEDARAKVAADNSEA